jgi:hypothetical protein
VDDRGVDDRLSALDSRVAQAVDAWFDAPLDAALYLRLMRAVQDRRAFLGSPPGARRPGDRAPGDRAPGDRGPGDRIPEPAVPGDAPPDAVPDDVSPDDVSPEVAARLAVPRVGMDLSGDPRDVLRRLRQG